MLFWTFSLGTTYLLYTPKFIIVRPFTCVAKKLHKYLPKLMKPNTFIYVYYEIHYEIWAVLHHLEGKIVFRSKMSMKWIFALKNSQNVYFHSKTHSASAVTRSGDDWTQVQLKHKIGQIGIDYHPFLEITWSRFSPRSSSTRFVSFLKALGCTSRILQYWTKIFCRFVISSWNNVTASGFGAL